MADLVTVSEGEAPARIAALIEMFESDAPAAELLVASRALEEQVAHLHDGKDWADDTCPLLHQLLALIAATPATKLAFTASVARCLLLQLGHLWHFSHERHEPFVAWVVQHLLRKSALPRPHLLVHACRRRQRAWLISTGCDEFSLCIRAVLGEESRRTFEKLEEIRRIS